MVSEEDHPHDGQESGSVHVVVSPNPGNSATAAAAASASTSSHSPSGSRDEGHESVPEDGWNPCINQDEAIKAQEQEIEREVAERNQLIGERIGLSVLLSEYPADDQVYRRKIEHLKSVYGTMRKSRPDGNCFFRAFGFALFNSLLNNESEIDRLSEVGRAVLSDLHSQGFSFTVDDFHDVFQECLSDLREGRVRTSQQLLDRIFNDNSRSDYLVVFLRLVTSSHLQKHSEFFQAFVEDGMSVKEFCAHEVEPMYKESDHMHVIAVTTATGVGVRINYLDRGGTADKINVHDFPEGVTDPQIHLLYRPGHYDVLYPKERTNVSPRPAATAAPVVNQEANDSSVTSSSPHSSSSSSSLSSTSTAVGSNGGTNSVVANGGSNSRSHAHVSSSSSSNSTTCSTSVSQAAAAAAAGNGTSPVAGHSAHSEGVSSSKNPRLDPAVSSSGRGNEDSNEPASSTS